MRTSFAAAIALCMLPAFAEAPAEEAPPADFTRFEFQGHPELSEALTAYAWRHFKHRGGNGTTLFNKEYLMLGDLWLNATEPRRGKAIQQVHREDLLAMQLDDEGYVHTHQHFSHAHDAGWPFPVWPQAGMRPGEFVDITAGWLFQEQPALHGWASDYLRQKPELARYYGSGAAQEWTVSGENGGIVDNAWQVKPASSDALVLSWPEGTMVDAFNAPFVQIRWTSEKPLGPDDVCQVVWTREGEAPLPANGGRSMRFYPEKSPLSKQYFHSVIPMHKHPDWNGRITGLQVHLPASGGTYRIDSIFTAYDTRHTINNPIFILASKLYFDFTEDTGFLRQQINRMRTALLYMRNAMKGAERNYIRVEWPGHDGVAGYTVNPDGSKTLNPGHGIGNNYWDLMPFGWDDFYATCQYYAATLAMADLEARIAENPQWGVGGGALMVPAETLSAHAEAIKAKANALFWNEETGRYYACIDKNGVAHDYGYTFLNLEAIWYGIVPPDRARSIMDWISGARIVEGDTSTGADIYHWRFGPRATTRRNVEWYGQAWHGPEGIPWGGQVQDGGAVLGFTFYDLWARHQVYGPDNALQRLQEIMEWDREVMAAGGYRAYYADGRHGTTLQGCGTPGGLGIDCEFYESSMLPAYVVLGLLGLNPATGKVTNAEGLPDALHSLTVHNLQYRGVKDLRVSTMAP